MTSNTLFKSSCEPNLYKEHMRGGSIAHRCLIIYHAVSMLVLCSALATEPTWQVCHMNSQAIDLLHETISHRCRGCGVSTNGSSN